MANLGRAERARRLIAGLAELYPEAECELDYRTPWQLLVATVLSAQCTDKRVNTVTSGLFERWPTPADLAGAGLSEVEAVVRPTGFFRVKAFNIRECARILVAEYGGDVPRDLDTLVALPGVGVKTAKVVLGEAFGIAAGIAVDTHVNRLSRRFGLTGLTDSNRIAVDLEKLIDRDEWITFSHRVILHGRRVCPARKPRCGECTLVEHCRQVGV